MSEGSQSSEGSQGSQSSISNILANNNISDDMIEIDNNIAGSRVLFSDYDENSFNDMGVLGDLDNSSASEGAGIITKDQQGILLKFIESDVAQLQLDIETKIMLHIQDVMKNPTSIDDNISNIRDIINVGEDTFIYLRSFAKSLKSTNVLKDGIASAILNLRNDLDKYNSAVINLRQQLLDYISKDLGAVVPEINTTQQGGEPTGSVDMVLAMASQPVDAVASMASGEPGEVVASGEAVASGEPVEPVEAVEAMASQPVDAIDAVDAVEPVSVGGATEIGTTADTAVQNGGRKRSRKATRTNRKRTRSRSRSRSKF